MIALKIPEPGHRTALGQAVTWGPEKWQILSDYSGMVAWLTDTYSWHLHPEIQLLAYRIICQI